MFIEEHLQELRRARFTPAATVRCLARAWQRGRQGVTENPEASRSLLLLGFLYFWLAFLGSVALAVTGGLGDARRLLVWTGVWLIPLTGLLILHVDLLRDRGGFRLSGANAAIALTAGRLAAVPAMFLLLAEQHWQAAFWVFIVGMSSDVVDGWLARRFRQETTLGVVLDPITDIFFYLAVFLGMWQAGLMGTLAGTLALVRYGGLLFGGAFITVVHGPVRINSTLPGKISGLILGTLVGYLLLGPAYGAGSLGAVLLPLAEDAIAVLLAAGVVHGAFMGWHNLRHAGAEAEAARKVIRGVRFGDRGNPT